MGEDEARNFTGLCVGGDDACGKSGVSCKR